MRTQRTTFFGCRPRKNPKKDGANPPVPRRRHAALAPEAITVRFDNDTVTQCGGYPLWAAFARRAGLNAKLAQHLKLERGPNAFTAPEAARFLIDAKVLGCARLMHVEAVRLDPLLTACAGLDGLPSGKTLGSFLKEHSDAHVAALDRLNVRCNDEQWRRLRRGPVRVRAARRVGLDYDASTFTVYGRQEEADRGRCFRKKDQPGFQPRFAFLAGLGVMVNQELRPQSHNLNRDFWAFHRASVAKLPRGAKLRFVRGDGGIYAQENIQAFAGDGLQYGVSAALTPHLQQRLAAIPETAWEEGQDEQGRPYSITRIRYRPATWVQPRTYILSRRLRETTGQEYFDDTARYKYFAYVTNYPGSAYEQFRFCTERCSLEGFIKEAKLGVHYDRLPCAEASANRAYLAYVQLAYNLAIYFKLQTAPAGVNRWTLNTVRARLLRVAGNLRRRAGQWVLSLARWWPYRSVFRRLWRTGLACGLAPP
jgi:hypothetical protein